MKIDYRKWQATGLTKRPGQRWPGLSEKHAPNDESDIAKDCEGEDGNDKASKDQRKWGGAFVVNLSHRQMGSAYRIGSYLISTKKTSSAMTGRGQSALRLSLGRTP